MNDFFPHYLISSLNYLCVCLRAFDDVFVSVSECVRKSNSCIHYNEQEMSYVAIFGPVGNAACFNKMYSRMLIG